MLIDTSVSTKTLADGGCGLGDISSVPFVKITWNFCSHAVWRTSEGGAVMEGTKASKYGTDIYVTTLKISLLNIRKFIRVK